MAGDILCALGEAINGAGGYFGKDIQSFDDCLFGGFGLTAPCRIVWRNADLSRRTLSSALLVAFCDDRLAEIERDPMPEMFEEGRRWLLATRAGITGRGDLFDMVSSRTRAG